MRQAARVVQFRHGEHVMSEGKEQTVPEGYVQEEARHHKLIDTLVSAGVGLGVMFIAWMAFTVYQTSLNIASMTPMVATIDKIDQRMDGLVTKDEMAKEVVHINESLDMQREEAKELEERVESLETRMKATKKDPVEKK